MGRKGTRSWAVPLLRHSRVHCIGGEKNQVCDVPWPMKVLCSSLSCQDIGGGTRSASIAALGRMSRFGMAPLLQIPSLTLVRGRVGAAEQGGIARAAGISAGTNPAAPYQMLPPCLRSLRQPSRAQLVLSGPLSPRLDASQWISMSHSNAEKLMIKKEFFLCIIPHLRLLSTPSPWAWAAQPQPWGPVMLRRWVMQEPCPWLTPGVGNQRSLFWDRAGLIRSIPAAFGDRAQGRGAGCSGSLCHPAPGYRPQTRHLQRRTLIKSTLW